jgi:hypothetical protein
MARVYKLGVHTFYRPRAWGDGSDDPIWGGVPSAGKPVSANVPPADAAKPSGSADAQRAPAEKISRTAKL